MSEALSETEIVTRLRTQFVGRAVEVHAEIGSTNTRASELARMGAPDGALVLAERQTAGRGRLGRAWHAPAGGSLLMSLVLRPRLAPAQAQRMTMIASVALVSAIRATTSLEARVKWPNDVQIAGKKVAGILTELGMAEAALGYVVVGMGINVNLDIAALPPLMAPTTSLSAEAGRRVSRLELLLVLLEEIERRYLLIREGWSPHEEWRAHLATLGQRVRVSDGQETTSGMAEDVDPDGALLVRTDTGDLERILVGDVTLRDPSVGHGLSSAG